MRPIADSWHRHLPNATFVTPDAPIKDSYGGHQWFKLDGMQLDQCVFRRRVTRSTERLATLFGTTTLRSRSSAFL
ncbi:hypothetical protein [Agrobacterium vitis]|uniref:hypothetical protein n=1 Tax=Agrobacterium vitis TaxID=373 RepID=UPI003B51D9A9